MKMLDKWEPQVINIPPQHGKAVKVSDPSYWGKLLLLSEVCVAPKFSADEWAIFGDKVGPTVIDEIINWACYENGITEHYAKLLERARKNSSAEDGE